MKIDSLLFNASQVVTCSGPGPKRGKEMGDIEIIEDGAVALADGQIVEVGSTRKLIDRYEAREKLNVTGYTIVPGLVDPHTHAVWAGDRVDEFERRLRGESYLEIMAAGGGIVSTTKAVRGASVEKLVEESRPRLEAMLRLGTTTAEIKTGYGLETAAEMRMLEAIEVLQKEQPLDLVPTFLGAHAIPSEYSNDIEGYLDLVTNEMLPEAIRWYENSIFPGKGVPFFNDVFCEQNAFDKGQSRRVLEAGLRVGLPAKIHADEFTSLGGVGLGVELGAVSIDHLDVTSPEDRQCLATSSSIGVVLPAVNFNLGSTHFALARAMIEDGCALALATDINPGSAPCPSMQLVMAIACRYMGLLPAEAFTASTINAACAIGLDERIGTLEPGKQADLLILKCQDYRQMAFQFGGNLVDKVIKKGIFV
jgi:imidazolonepropionase